MGKKCEVLPLCSYEMMNQQQLEKAYSEAKNDYDCLINAHLSLNMARGKPSTEQLGLVDGIFSMLYATGCDIFHKRRFPCTGSAFYEICFIIIGFKAIFKIRSKPCAGVCS